MQNEMLTVLEAYTTKNRRRSIWKKIVRIMACFVVFCTTYALILPAITQERTTFCGMEEHVHSDTCFQTTTVLLRQLTCTVTGDVAHSHNQDCLDENGELICPLPEREQHVHTEACYTVTQPHVHTEDCYMAAQTHTHEEACYAVIEPHVHAEGCYSLVQGELECQTETSEEHEHSDACYTWTQTVICGLQENTEPQTLLICGQEENPETQALLVCGQEENGETEPVLICTDPLVTAHVHSDSCFTVSEVTEPTAEPVLVCSQEEHQHILMCYSNPEADLETQEQWERSIAFAERTGNWRQDVVAIAYTQLGYAESTKNYVVLADGETTKGYTRYGEWYHDPYGDWCAMFAAFCMNYAGVERIPVDSSVKYWIGILAEPEVDLFRSQGSYVPDTGDLIFFDWEQDGIADHVGIVTALTAGEDGSVPQIATIEGNVANRVQERSYSLDDAQIMGYCQLPVQLTAQEQYAVDLVSAKIEALPSADTIDGQLKGYAEAGDTQGEEAYYTQTSQQVAEAYYRYSALSDEQKTVVSNADKLMALEHIWSVTEYQIDSNIRSEAVTVAQSAHTGDFVNLNIYDYYGAYSAGAANKTDINQLFEEVSREFPGFQWNAGAFPYRYYVTSGYEFGWVADRNLAQCLDFGNSLITDYRITEPLFVPDQTAGTAESLTGEQSGGSKLVTDRYGDTGAINQTAADDAGNFGNRPIGITENETVVSDRLGEDGYPYLSRFEDELDEYSPSLGYLFDEDRAYAAKMNTQNVDGLFRQDPVSGEYYYNSRWNHAQYSEETSAFTLYDQTITPNFILYPFGNFLPFSDITAEQKATQVQAINYQGGVADYFQTILDELQDRNTVTGGADLSVVQLISMLESYRNSWACDDLFDNAAVWSALTAQDVLNDYANRGNQDELTARMKELYNIDYDVEKNFLFGMDMSLTFMQPKNGLTGNDNGSNATGSWVWGLDKNDDTLTPEDDTMMLTGEKDGIPDYPMIFSFAGDDDVWVYIDGIRFLDLSGIHACVGGRIDFEQGMVYYYQKASGTNCGLAESPFAQQSFRQILTEYGGIAEADLGKYLKQDADGNFTIFHDYSTHTFNFYYLERSAGSSACSLSFNFPLIRKNSISVTQGNTAPEETVLGNPDYYFNILSSENELFVGPNSVTGVTKYQIRDANGDLIRNEDGTIKLFTTDPYGIFTLKAGQTAIFEGIGENQGMYFVQELIREADNSQYPLVYVNDLESTGNDLIDWSFRKYFHPEERTAAVYEGPYGCRWYGRSGAETDASSAGSFCFEQHDQLAAEQLAKLTVSSELNGEAADRTFSIAVTMDGELLPVGTRYTVGDEERTVTEAGIVTLSPGQTAQIGSILSGTEFEVREIDGDGYTVTYDYAGNHAGDAAAYAQNDSVTGVLRAGGDVTVTVTNTEKGAVIQIPVSVSFLNGDGAEHDCAVVLEQVTDSTGAVLTENGLCLEKSLAGVLESASFDFTIPYLLREMDVLPATFYYRITQQGEEAHSMDNTQQYIAEVLVEADGDSIRATLVSLNGASEYLTADFVNVLQGSLTLTRIVNGSSQVQTEPNPVDYDMTLTPPENIALAPELTAVRTDADGVQTTEKLQVQENNLIRIADVKPGETIVLTGLPAGTRWEITQTTATGYIITTRVADETGKGIFTNGTVTVGDTAVTYTNTQTYVLPATGGTGTTQYTMAGWMLMLCSAAYLLYMYTERRRGVHTSP